MATATCRWRTCHTCCRWWCRRHARERSTSKCCFLVPRTATACPLVPLRLVPRRSRVFDSGLCRCASVSTVLVHRCACMFMCHSVSVDRLVLRRLSAASSHSAHVVPFCTLCSLRRCCVGQAIIRQTFGGDSGSGPVPASSPVTAGAGDGGVGGGASASVCESEIDVEGVVDALILQQRSCSHADASGDHDGASGGAVKRQKTSQ